MGEATLRGFTAATWNVRGISEVGKRQRVEEWMRRAGIDLLTLQETKANRAQTQRQGVVLKYWSRLGDGGGGRSLAGGRLEGPAVARKAVEHFGVGMLGVSTGGEALGRAPHGSELRGAALTTICCAAPHAAQADGDKEGFYDALRARAREAKGAHALLIGGDFNARILRETGPMARHLGTRTLPPPLAEEQAGMGEAGARAGRGRVSGGVEVGVAAATGGQGRRTCTRRFHERRTGRSARSARHASEVDISRSTSYWRGTDGATHGSGPGCTGAPLWTTTTGQLHRRRRSDSSGSRRRSNRK